MNSKLRDILEKLYDNATVAHKTIGINNAKSVDVPEAEKAILALFESYAAEREQLERKRHVLIEGGLRQELNEIKNAIRVLAALQGEE